MVNKVSKDVKDILENVKALVESKKAMKEELSRLQEDLDWQKMSYNLLIQWNSKNKSSFKNLLL